MKIPKRITFFVLIFVLIALILGGFAFVIKQIYAYWDDESTWTTEERVIFPAVSQSLKMSITGSLTKGDFSVALPYCQLYSVTKTDTQATLHCSLLPSYYTLRQNEVPKDWSEQTDVKLVINQGDVTPEKYLGRIDKSFSSVQSFGYEAVPVTILVSGVSVRPEKSLQNVINHAQKAYEKKKDMVAVSITSWSVQELNTVTDPQKTAYAAQWKQDVAAELSAFLNEKAQQKKVAQEYLNDMRKVLAQERVVCADLSHCSYGYQGNSAEKLVYYVYGQKAINPEVYDHALSVMKTNLFPFTTAPRPTGTDGKLTCATCTVDWLELSAYSFPICPINDVIAGKASSNYTDILKPYVEIFASQSVTIPNTEPEVMSRLSTYSPDLFKKVGDWDADFVDNVNVSCYFLLKNGPDKYPTAKARVIKVYFAMLSDLMGVTINPDKASMESVIYNGTVYSPYKSAYLTDFAVSRFREDVRLTTSPNAAKSYTEWRSILGTLILLYTYNGISN